MFGLVVVWVLCFVKYVLMNVRVAVGWSQRSVVVDGDNYGWLRVLKEVLGVHLGMGAW